MQIPSLLRAKIEGTTFLGGGFRRLRERDQLWVVPIAVLGTGVALVAIVSLLYQNYRAMATMGSMIGLAELPLYVAVLAGWAIIFVLGFPIAISVLYFSRDTRLLASLPIPAYRIVAANAGLLYLYALPAAVLFIVPGLVAAYDVVAAAGTGIVQYVLASLLVTAAVPVVPLALAVLVVTAVTRLVNLSRFRTGLEAMGMVLIVVALVGVQLALSRSLMSGGSGASIPEALESLLTRLHEAVPPARWYAGLFLPGGVAMGVVAMLGTAAVGVLAVSAVQAGYLRRLSNQAVTRTRRRRSTPGTMPSGHPPVVSLMMREIKLLTSNSTFLFESAGEIAVFPIILLVIRLATPSEFLAEILPFLDQTDYLIPIVTGALVLFAGINSVSSAALSREGKTFDLSLSLPLRGSTQVAAKVLTYLVLFGTAFLANAVLATWILARPWWYAPVVFASGIPFLWLIGTTTIYADIRRPLLHWNHPQQAVKQNMNVLLGMGITVIIVGVTVAPSAIAALRGALPALVMILASGFALVVALVVSRLVMRYADRRYATAFAAL